ncbi:hypothetical protein IG631_02634 [Alternaria alternata]|jgi:hypothetical protein|nr:hypothetical protein IG631_02634 [Alternaria alternata]
MKLAGWITGFGKPTAKSYTGHDQMNAHSATNTGVNSVLCCGFHERRNSIERMVVGERRLLKELYSNWRVLATWTLDPKLDFYMG